MQAIEFETEIHQGMIKLPNDYRQWSERSVRVILLENDQPTTISRKRRQPHPAIAGKGKTLGDLVAPVVSETDWECLK
uniref:Uncharacterized protein n=1 Tax=Candidatus Kentrum sp. FM TaxID=2126340 RepID=A0A450RW29_9GAMM|nr:MAG: hypothetical protein BECKFM1743A_GA0114220_1000712 [Candidatus Kentron sp. FM]VFJ43953.1 MAG: hypothetical protein BECKFM1743C_GA0114222_100079 [Candidatus Kentron sp. FM]VFK06026.1 MAG: hypothetical protein BECKFM1743B_GA0114221_1000912 [Candidatus Kentron sp. FM]